MNALLLDDPLEITLVGLAAMLAGFVRGFSGFGGPAVLLMLMLPFYSPLAIVPKIVVIDLACNLHLLPTSFREVDMKTTWPWFVASALAVPFGHLLLLSSDPEPMRQFISIVVAVAAVVMLAGWRFRRTPPFLVGILVAFIAGMLMGAFYIALIMMWFFFSLPHSAATSRAHAIFWAFVTGTMLLFSQLVSGAFSTDAIGPTAILALAYLLGAGLGAKLFRGTGEQLFRKAVLCLLVVLAGVALIS